VNFIFFFLRAKGKLFSKMNENILKLKAGCYEHSFLLGFQKVKLSQSTSEGHKKYLPREWLIA